MEQICFDISADGPWCENLEHIALENGGDSSRRNVCVRQGRREYKFTERILLEFMLPRWCKFELRADG